ncbi:MAG: MFS transporter [Desulfotalea sp.]
MAKWLMLIMPIVALYYTENGLTTFDIYLLQAIYSFSVAWMEIPSGYMADVIGRRKSLLAGSILGCLGYIIYATSSGFVSFVVAEIILGLGGSFISGSDSALLYDSLAANKQKGDYLRYEGRITSFGNFAETLAAIGGGLLAVLVSYRGVYIAQAAVAFIAIPAAFMLIEPPRVKRTRRPSFGEIVSICHQSIFINKKLSATLFISSACGVATLCMAWTSQIYFVHKGLDEVAITPIWVGLNLVVALISVQAYRVQSIIGGKRAVLSIIFYIPLGYIILGISPLWLGLVNLFVFYAIRGYATPLLKNYTNKHCGAEVRATVLSIRSLMIRLSFSVLGPMIGFLSGRFSMEEALVAAGIILLVCSVASGLFFFRVMSVDDIEGTTE